MTRFPRPARLLALVALVVAAVAAMAAGFATSSPGPRPAPDRIAGAANAGSLTSYGPDGRHLLDGRWLFRLDRRDAGVRRGFASSTSTAGWRAVSVPNAWNATDQSRASFHGTVGWYRKDFRLPEDAPELTWVVRFESVNYRSTIWLNGHRIALHAGAFLPFEVPLPGAFLQRTGVNHLVLRVDDRRGPRDFPPSYRGAHGQPIGGWWNYGGILREVELRRIDRIDFASIVVRPQLPCPRCAARVLVKVKVRNVSAQAQRVTVDGRFGSLPVPLGTRVVPAHGKADYQRSIVVRRPRLWAPGSPNLYDVNLTATAPSGARQHYFLRSGIRSIRIAGGRLYLNGRRLNVRGVGLHEDSRRFGFAIGDALRDRQLRWVRELGATMIRAHYPLSAYTEEQADRLGILLWSEVPVWQFRSRDLAVPSVRALAAREVERDVLVNANHPSILLWSIGNELDAKPGPPERAYLREAAHEAHRLDPTRPVGLALRGDTRAGCHRDAYAPIDVLGINEYIGWYGGSHGVARDRAKASRYLDSVHRCYPGKALMVTEFGAEANRPGPARRLGTYAYQVRFATWQLRLFASKPWLNGALYWALQEFRARPGWAGGNPRPTPPLHTKGLVSFDGHRKPAFYAVQRIFRHTRQIGPPR